MNRYFRQHLVLALALAALVPTLSFAQNKLVVAIQPTVASDEMLNKAKPLQQFLEKSLGGKTKVEIYVPTSYAAVVESLRFGHAHVAFMSAWPAQLAVRLGGAEVGAWLCRRRRPRLRDPDLFAKFGLSTARNHFVVGARYRAGHGRDQRVAETTLSFIGSSVVSEAIV